MVPDLANPFFPPLIKAAQSRARRAELELYIADTDEHRYDELPLVRAITKQVDGLVLASPRMSDAELREVVAMAPTVLVNRRVDGAAAVLIPSADGMRQAVEHLYALGHRRCMYLGGPSHSWSNAQRRAAVRATCRRLGISYTAAGPLEPRYESGVRAADLVLADGATAVIAYDDLIALGVIARLKERGVQAGRDISVIGTDDSPFAAIATPPLTSIRVPSASAGNIAIKLLLDLLASGGTDDPPRIELSTELIVRATTVPAASSVTREGGQPALA